MGEASCARRVLDARTTEPHGNGAAPTERLLCGWRGIRDSETGRVVQAARPRFPFGRAEAQHKVVAKQRRIIHNPT